MTWTLTKRWVNPPNWDGTAENSKVRHAEVIISGTSDGSDELTNEVFVDISNLQNVLGEECTKTSIRKISWECTSLTSLTLKFDRSPNEIIKVLADSGSEDFSSCPIQDTGEAGDGTGDIIATTAGSANTDAFSVRLEFTVK